MSSSPNRLMSGQEEPTPGKRPYSKWVKFGIPVVVVVVIVAAVVGGVVGSKAKNKNGSASSSSANGGSGGGGHGGSGGGGGDDIEGRFATATASEWMMPIYPSTDSPAFATPTFLPSPSAEGVWPAETFQPANPDILTTRPDRPRLIAPSYKWAALPNLINNDPYLQGWNDTIFGNATDYFGLPPVVYHMDGASGILDNAREIKMRIKAFAYVYRLTNDTKWVDRTWDELQNAVSDSFGPSGTGKWNPAHFLDTAELSAAFGIAYDWLYSQWSDDQKTTIRTSIIQYGLNNGVDALTTGTNGFWTTNTQGNWNCVCNGGLTLGALAILGDDTSGVAEKVLGLTVDNAKANCAQGVTSDGTWTETANYWYFGTTGHAEMASSLLTATGSHYGLLDTNTNFHLTGLFHMYAYGPTSLFDFGDHGPNKFSTTANSLFLYADQYTAPEYALFQREQHDAAEPWSMFWYDPTVSGAFWNSLPLDRFFDDGLDQWGSMRSSWTDSDALFVAIKAGKLQGHQTHNDLDVGDFVLDALGTRWAGEFGSGDYLAPDYFTSDAQDAVRWQYYRKMTEGQNTILVNRANQNVAAAPTVNHDSSGTEQGSSTVFTVPDGSTAYWTTDMTSAYFDATSVKRGVRLLNERRQVLLQDEINATGTVDWRMHTNATVETSGTTATLTRDGQTMIVSILNPPTGAAFTTTEPAARYPTDPTPPAPDQPNPGITVLIISLPAGQYTLEVLFSPQWPKSLKNDGVIPPSVALDSWSLTSHN
ncbi:hypothetical protein BDN72DRAFT_263863 [Pluteus cervinus]|uniref:Uncharacterized protein n=1 Tax=Pluteus cervinus TaxID=181527 RepID=A0ACD3AFW1_9AGAR|nr:hypothetical protein BDN72DRAFT_263863 [Pluteus cervinus]